MHLPPLDVAVYPIVTMSYGRHGGSSIRTSSSMSTSSSLSTSSRTTTTTSTSPDFSGIQKVIRNVFRSSKITVQQAERLQGRLHQVYLARLTDGSSLVLKCPPASSTRMLRHEKHSLETEQKTLETLREYTQLSVPQVIKYDKHGGALGRPFLMMSYLPGRRLSELSSFLSASERKAVDRTLGAYVRSLTTISATQFGSTHRVFGKKGSTSWREAFLALLESALRDAEDMLITVPYDSIRSYVRRHSQCLDEVIEPRLVALNCCDPENVLIDEQTKQVTGLVGFSNVIWGDPLMTGGILDGTEAFFEGYGQCPARSGSVKARLSMYSAYRAILKIASHYYRPHLEIDELEARRSLINALRELAEV